LEQAGFLTQGASEPGFANTAGTGNHQVARICDPAPGGELLEQSPVQFAWRAEVDMFDGGPGVAPPCCADAGLEAPGIAAGDLAVDEQAKPFGVTQIGAGALVSASR